MTYKPPTFNAVALNFSEVYTPPAFNAVALDLRPLGGVETLPIVGVTRLAFATSKPDLWFPWVGASTLSITSDADLTIHIELVATVSFTFGTAGVELTIGYQVQGVVTEMGIPVQRLLRVYDALDGSLLAEGQSDPGDGTYVFDLFDHKSEIYVQCLGSAEYGPLVQGPVEPERL